MAKEWSISGGAGDATIGSDGKAFSLKTVVQPTSHIP